MGMEMSGGSGMSFPHGGPMFRAFARDRSVVQEKLSKETLIRILGYARPYRALVIVFLVTIGLDAIFTVIPPLLFQRIVDDGIEVGDASVVTISALLVALVAVLDAGVGMYSRYLSARIGEGLIYDLRRQVFSHVQRQSIAFFTRAETGALVSRLNSDVIGAQQAFTSTLSGVLGNLITVVVILITMFLLSWQITLLALILVPLFLFPARWMGRRLQVLTRSQMIQNAELSTQSTERFNVSGALLVKLFGRPAEEDASYADRAAGVRDVGIRIAMANRYFMTALALVAALATAIAYGVGGNFVINGSLSLGTLLALIALLAQLYGPLTALSNVRVDVMTALVSFDRVFEVLDLPALVSDREDAEDLEPGQPTAVSLRHVGFTYPSAREVSLASLESVARKEAHHEVGPALVDVDFEVPPGNMVALVGPSGAGKTTITALVSRLYDAKDGQVLVGGRDVRDVTQESLHNVVGVVTQDAHLFHDTIAANLRYAKPDATDAELMSACEDAAIADLIRSLPQGFDTIVGDRGHRLSGGEKQRLAIARLLLKGPDVVVLDEATAHLDSENEQAVQSALRSALRGRTALVIAHRLSTIREADSIVVVDRGRVVETGTHAELLARNGLYAQLYRTQFAVAES
ncbi:MAG: ABC transporter ATP-binding protein [Actinobacteria bacterium]|nr:ABC transporter ATP-binding protein [Actinomycetota bacterium]